MDELEREMMLYRNAHAAAAAYFRVRYYFLITVCLCLSFGAGGREQVLELHGFRISNTNGSLLSGGLGVITGRKLREPVGNERDAGAIDFDRSQPRHASTTEL